MVSLIKNETPAVGIYLTEDASSEIVANNAPGETDLAVMTEGNGYCYVASVIRFEHVVSTVTKGDDYKAHTFSNVGAGIQGHWTGQADTGNVVIIGEVDNATAAKIKQFVKRNNRTGDAQKFLIHVYSSTVYEQFPDEDGTLKNYLPIWTSGVSVVEVDGNKDRKMVSIGGWEYWT